MKPFDFTLWNLRVSWGIINYGTLSSKTSSLRTFESSISTFNYKRKWMQLMEVDGYPKIKNLKKNTISHAFQNLEGFQNKATNPMKKNELGYLYFRS